jgi:oligopeptidase A
MFKVFNANLDEIKRSIEEIIDSNYREVELLLSDKNPTYQSSIKLFQTLEDRLELEFTQISHLNSVNNSEDTQEVYNYLLPIITEYSTKISQDKRLYDLYKVIKDKEYNDLTLSQQKVLDDGILGFELSGSHLEEDKKERLAKINLRFSSLQNDFSQNVLNATNAYELIITDEKDVEGVPENDLASAKVDEGYRFTLQMPSYIAYMTYGPNSNLRETLYKAYTTRAPENSEIIDEILALRDEKSKILGFDSYSEYSLATKMATTPLSVTSFLRELAQKSKTQAIRELEELEKYANMKLSSWDVAYYSEKLRVEKYSVDEEMYRPYFEKNSVVNGLFKFLNNLLGIEFKQVELDLWDEKAVAYDIYEDNQIIARIYLDLEARESKRGGAWMHNWQAHSINSDDFETKASAFVVCNFPPSSKDNPSLLRHSDVVTLFHEMGHAIHHLLSKVDESFVSGVNGVEWDAVEFPSQFLEEFAYEKDVLQTFAIHHESLEVISDEMIERLKRAKNFQSAMAMLRQLEFGLFDFELHSSLYSDTQVQNLLNRVREEVSVIVPPSYNKFQNSFSHIFAGGYSAGYYSYKWAEVLSSDAFLELIKSNFNNELVDAYKKNILYSGGSQSMQKLFKNFLKREPNVDNLLKISGIN